MTEPSEAMMARAVERAAITADEVRDVMDDQFYEQVADGVLRLVGCKLRPHSTERWTLLDEVAAYIRGAVESVV